MEGVAIDVGSVPKSGKRREISSFPRALEGIEVIEN